jgi:hypothetical protein
MIRNPKFLILSIVALTAMVPFAAHGKVIQLESTTIYGYVPHENDAETATRKPARVKKSSRVRPVKTIKAAETPNEAFKSVMEVGPLTVPASVAPTEPRELESKELGKLFLGFKPKTEGKDAKLMGVVFNDCMDPRLIQIETGLSCKGSPAFRIVDMGALRCMDAHRIHRDKCDAKKGPEEKCSFAESFATMSLAGQPTGEVKLMRTDPNENVEANVTCEGLGMNWENPFDRAKREAAERAAKRAADLRLAKDQVANCTSSTRDFEVARRACETLVALHEYTSVDECQIAEHRPAKELSALNKFAAEAELSNMEEVRTELVAWANNHPGECKKVVPALREIVRRQIAAGNGSTSSEARRRKFEDADLDDDIDPLDAYDDGLETLARSREESSCLRRSSTLTQIKRNVRLNRLDKMGQTLGTRNVEFQTEYASLYDRTQTEMFNSTCNPYEMNPNCMSIQTTAYSLPAIYQSAYQTEMQRVQSQMAMQQMFAMSPNYGVGTMGMGGAAAFGGMPGMNNGFQLQGGPQGSMMGGMGMGGMGMGGMFGRY